MLCAEAALIAVVGRAKRAAGAGTEAASSQVLSVAQGKRRKYQYQIIILMSRLRPSSSLLPHLPRTKRHGKICGYISIWTTRLDLIGVTTPNILIAS